MSWLLSLSEEDRNDCLKDLTSSSKLKLASEIRKWRYWGRPDQFPPGSKRSPDKRKGWFIWLIQAGRGWGKTRTGAQYVKMRTDAKKWRVVNVAGPTWTDVMDTMVHGSERSPGLMGLWPDHQKPELKMGSSNPHIITHNGAMIRLRAAREAERFRGPQADGGWADEIDAWAPLRMKPGEAFALFEMGIRTGTDPRIVATSTPKRGRLIAELRERPDCVVTLGRTLDNRDNLAPQFIKSIMARYGGTYLGRQELEGELLQEVERALVTTEMIDNNRRDHAPDLEDMERITVGVDPSGTEGGDEKGIIVTGRSKGQLYVLDDRSTRKGPDGWGKAAVIAFMDYKADKIVAESNYGGDMVGKVISQAAKDLGVPNPRVELIHASRGKHVRFQPVAMLYEQDRAHHCGHFPELEDEIVCFTDDGYEGGGSPNRGDALAWAVHDLGVAFDITWMDLYPSENSDFTDDLQPGEIYLN